MSASSPFLQLQSVSYQYPGWPTVVDAVSWDVAPGEFHCLVGRSGCGKTTLLKLAAGLLKPTAGQVCVSGQVLQQVGSGIGFVFQSPTLLEWLSVLDNVLLPIALHQTPSSQDRARAQALLDQVGLLDRAGQRPYALSGGQQSRVAIARALVREPRLLLMDEPFAALDAITREELQDELLTICSSRGTSVLFVTHDITESVYLADRVAVMAQGRIQDVVAVGLPRPRQRMQRYSPAFNALCAQVRQAMDDTAQAVPQALVST